MNERLQQSIAFLERLHADDRERAQKKFDKNPRSLSDYELKLLDLTRADVMKPTQVERAQQARQEARDKIAAVLRPKHIVFRNAFLQSLNEHAIELAVKHSINVVREYLGRERANSERRTVYTPGITSEATYAAFTHEVAHIVNPDADSEQYDYTLEKSEDGRRSCIAPTAEIAAWKWAVLNAERGWTHSMHGVMCRALASYAPHATVEERDQMKSCIRWSVSHLTGEHVVTREDVEMQCKAISDCATTRSQTQNSVNVDSTLEQRVKELEQREYQGVWSHDRVYAKGALVTRGGSIYHSEVNENRAIPGQHPHWVLAVKAGRDLRDSR